MLSLKLEDIKRVAVIGAGTMGHGIAQVYASGGLAVNLYDVNKEALTHAQQMIKINLETFVEEGLMDESEANAAFEKIAYFDNLKDAVQNVQFVQETVPEKPDIKIAVFKELDDCLPADIIIVSNTSALNPFELVPQRRLSHFTTAHFFAPPQIIPLVEVAKGEETTEQTIEITLAILRKCGKTPVRLEKFVAGFIVNRLQILLNREVFYLLDNGICTPDQLDLAVKASFMPRGMVLGLVQRIDFTGLDISASNIINESYKVPEMGKRPKVLFEHVDKGELGVKTGKGFYDYGGRSYAEVCKKRDKLLFQVLKATKDIMNETI